MTVTGVLLIPLALALLFMPWRIMLMALPSFALLHSAAVVNVGSIGLQPGYFLALLVIMRTGLEILLLRQRLNRDALILTAPLAVLVVVSLLVLWISVAFFTAKVTVIGGTDGYVLESARPYAFRRENVAQISYIVVNTMLVYALAHQSARLRPGQLLRVIDRGVIAAALLALAVCGWQLLAHATGIYFPSDFLFSNVGYLRADNQNFFGSLRLNGPFSEPSSLAYFFSGFLLYFWKRSRLQPTLLSTLLISALTGTIFLAYSTTGYFVLAIFMAIFVMDLTPSVRRRLRTFRLHLAQGGDRRRAAAGRRRRRGVGLQQLGSPAPDPGRLPLRQGEQLVLHDAHGCGSHGGRSHRANRRDRHRSWQPQAQRPHFDPALEHRRGGHRRVSPVRRDAVAPGGAAACSGRARPRFRRDAAALFRDRAAARACGRQREFQRRHAVDFLWAAGGLPCLCPVLPTPRARGGAGAGRLARAAAPDTGARRRSGSVLATALSRAKPCRLKVTAYPGDWRPP